MMKLSEIKGERTLDVIADVIGPIANIAGDKAAADLFTKKKLPEGADPKAFLVQRVTASVPVLLKEHKKDVIAILAAIEGVSQKEYAASLDLVKIVRDCIDLATDEAFMALFISAQSGGPSSSAPGNTEVAKV